MITIRNSGDRGRADHGWLDTRHTFSFAGYFDRGHTGFRALRVLNEDRVAPGAGFGAHDHSDMEIVSYVLDGRLEHRDSTGTGSVLKRGDVQRMTAGSGIRHSERNPSSDEPVHFLQVWLHPRERGLKPGYEERHFSDDDKRGRLRRILSGSGSDDALAIQQDVEIYAGLLEDGTSVRHALRPDRHAWVQVLRGGVSLDGRDLAAGDGAAVSDEPELTLLAADSAEVLVFDLA